MKNRWWIGCGTLVLMLGLTGCGSSTEPAAADAAEAIPDTVTVTAAQQAQAGFRFARLTQQTIPQTVQVAGQVEVPPSNLASVSSPLAGFIRQAEWLQGMRIRKGQVLTVVDNPELLLPMEQSYLEAQARLEFLEAEVTRNRTLVEAEVGAERNLQQVDAERKQLQARVSGLAAQLSALGVNVERLAPGRLQRQVTILAPISGVITQVGINLGKRVEPTDVLFTIVDPAHLHIELRVFEQDLPKIRKGQVVHVTLSNQADRRHEGEVYVVNPALDEGQGARVHVHLKDERVEQSLLPGMHLTAEITVASDQTVAVPTQAVLRVGERSYLWQQVGPERVRAVPVQTSPLNADWLRIDNAAQLDTTARYLMGNASLLRQD